MLVSEVSAPGCAPRVLPMYFLLRARAFWNQTWSTRTVRAEKCGARTVTASFVIHNLDFTMARLTLLLE